MWLVEVRYFDFSGPCSQDLIKAVTYSIFNSGKSDIILDGKAEYFLDGLSYVVRILNINVGISNNFFIIFIVTC